jgi:hypothetical protein
MERRTKTGHDRERVKESVCNFVELALALACYASACMLCFFGKSFEFGESGDGVFDELGMQYAGPSTEHGRGSRLFELVDCLLMEKRYKFSERDGTNTKEFFLLELEMFDGGDEMGVGHDQCGVFFVRLHDDAPI